MEMGLDYFENHYLLGDDWLFDLSQFYISIFNLLFGVHMSGIYCLILFVIIKDK